MSRNLGYYYLVDKYPCTAKMLPDDCRKDVRIDVVVVRKDIVGPSLYGHGCESVL